MKQTKKKYLFIISDDEAANIYYEEIFKDGNYELSFCKEKEYAADFVITMCPDVVILDLVLSGKVEGFDILTRIGKLPEIITIVITAMIDRETRMRVLELGADYLTKPVRKLPLKRMVNSYMRISKEN